MYCRGGTPRFNFKRFIDRQKECYKRLRDVGYNGGMGLDDASMCSNLKQMILPEAQLENALSLARTQGLFNCSFDNLVHFLKAEVNELTLRRSQLRANRGHRISSLSGRANMGRGRGGRGRGRGMNRNQDGNLNRSRQIITRMVDGRRIHNGNYSPNEYRRLTPAQREAVRDMRRQAYRNQRNNRNDTNDRSHSVNAVSHTNGPREVISDDATGADGPPSSTESTVRFAQAGNVGGYLGNRRNYQASNSSE